MSNGTLYLVPTPIGNLEDITLRALRVLKEVDFVLCEDTRQTVKLLNHYGIQKPLVSFYTQNQERRIPGVLRDLRSGKNVALVSDSGTPGISDPGSFLVSAALEADLPVVSLPGPNAVVTALVASGLPTNGFVFLGFLKRKAGKLKKELRNASTCGKTIVFYESPHRVKKTLELCVEVFGGGCRAVLARELTKKFEEYVRGTLESVTAQIREREMLGEFVVLLSPAADEQTESEEGPYEESD